jgi:hypothetical protein
MADDKLTISVEQAMTNIKNVLANANGNLQMHQVLQASYAVVESELKRLAELNNLATVEPQNKQKTGKNQIKPDS